MREDFELCAGAICLDLVDTLSANHGDPQEMLNSPEDLDRWFSLSCDVKIKMPKSNAKDLREYIALRDAIHGVASALIADTRPTSANIALINKIAASSPPPWPALKGGDIVYQADRPHKAVLAQIAADAVTRLSAQNRSKLRACPDCGMLFFDNSRAQKRVWCSCSSGCGNRAKVRRHRAQKAKQK